MADQKFLKQMQQYHLKQVVALTGRNTTGPPCRREATIRPEAAWRHCLAAACSLAVQCYRRLRQTPV